MSSSHNDDSNTTGDNRGRGTKPEDTAKSGDDRAQVTPIAPISPDDRGMDQPAKHDLGDDKGVDTGAKHDVGDDKGVDDPATHDTLDDKGVDQPGTHDVGDDHGQHALSLFVNEHTQQLIFSADNVETEHWRGDDSKQALSLPVALPAADDSTVAVWRFHDPSSDVFFWTTDSALKDSLIQQHPELSFDGQAFRAFHDQASGGHTAVGVVWNRDAGGPYGSFTYAPDDVAVQLAGVSTEDHVEYLGVAFWL